MQNLTNAKNFGYACPAVAKSTASREKLKQNPEANSTPNRAFFVRYFRTPKENALSVVLSMVGRNRHAFSVAANPLGAVSHPVTLYRPTVRSLAVVIKLSQGLSKMIYKFLLLGDTRLTVRIRAKTEQEARSKIKFTSPAICIARFRENPTACTMPTHTQGGVYA